MGLLGINMPLLYGEGTEAFFRLQLEAIKTAFDDHTFLAWEASGEEMYRNDYSYFAPTPAWFKNSGNINPYTGSWCPEVSVHMMTNKGLEIELPLHYHPAGDNKFKRFAVLEFCHDCPDSYQPNTRLEKKTFKRERIHLRAVRSRESEDSPLELKLQWLRLTSVTGVFGKYTVSNLQNAWYHKFSDKEFLAPVMGNLVDIFSEEIHPTTPISGYYFTSDASKGSRFLIVFGKHRGHLWLRLCLPSQISRKDLTRHSRLSYGDVYGVFQGNYVDSSPWITNRATIQLPNGSGVVASAKKRRLEERAVWDLTVHIDAEDYRKAC
ncbi:hypothetical protein GQ43DRAFT_460855 [Delitschia confertaspora ATCC 74209]|uniref:Uncharacterized protein n=1 Tax=Delitschia confertaspora ATCC 74209 TaxID=1513339 RepID=A0A9P4JSE7_9PLEO|nr:hypothetical protein GQ43DRAFT_460855 [Delitschia confertaspora ATCC 74209]